MPTNLDKKLKNIFQTLFFHMKINTNIQDTKKKITIKSAPHLYETVF